MLVGAAPEAGKKGKGFCGLHLFATTFFCFSKKRAAPVAGPAFFGARSARLKNSTAATRSPSFLCHRRRTARSPPFRRSSSSEKRKFPPPRSFRPAGGALFLFSPIARFARKRSRAFQSNGAPRAPTLLLHSYFFTLHCPSSLRAALSFSFLRLLASLAKGQGQRHSIGGRALRAFLNFSFLISHCPFPFLP